MMDRHEGRENARRDADARTAASSGQGYARRIDCCDSPGSRERGGGGRGPGTPDPEAYAARTGGTDVY
ncbi:MAG TPA: hypothetical protein VHG51_19765 [Longimicrobiaceae bacterium]|nr:hypothetical protein [Longimicrobiaceae bacterium]